MYVSDFPPILCHQIKDMETSQMSVNSLVDAVSAVWCVAGEGWSGQRQPLLASMYALAGEEKSEESSRPAAEG